ncbi:hypothetical protein RI543_000211 [Arxiozyma heterogenica]|uniref:Survival protein SurE-like phosphatase/nucleotidase domain-containing protein n=1 Tax=Arxiozyma heterogenica TaxID=278026 RepID=A0AAN7ZZ53_9SACH|nr:hypothetical protein RI543_000211 [Kazachstania heterogenica]
MNVLITNDDGPLNDEFSPYIKHFIYNILKFRPDWNITIVVPNVQRSWNSKAHLAGKDLTLTYIYTDPTNTESNNYFGPFLYSIKDQLSNHNLPNNCIEWCLIDGTPASCVNIALHHLKPSEYNNNSTHTSNNFDLVISGPNVGRNTSAAYITSSATVGAAMESVITANVKSIALSWAYFNGQKFIHNENGILDIAARQSLDIITHLYHNWDTLNTDLYSINVPLLPSLSMDTKVFMAPIWENRWDCMFDSPAKSKLSLESHSTIQTSDIEDGSEYKEQSIVFKWNPKFQSHYDSKHVSKHRHDMQVLEDGDIAVTPLRAVFQMSSNVLTQGQLIIDHPHTQESKYSIVLSINSTDYIYKPLRTALVRFLSNVSILSNLNDSSLNGSRIFHFADYEQLNMDRLSTDPNCYFANCYIYRKALIRKHYLANTIHNYIVKHPESILINATLDTYTIDLDYAEFLDDSLDENWELRKELEDSPNTGKWWIVKPSMSDKGQGIRVFQTIDQLQAIFDSFDDEVDGEAPLPSSVHDSMIDNNKIIISQLRHFIVQEYLTNPLLLPSMSNRKFHIRCYITCVGDLNVYVYDRMLALFAPVPFISLKQFNVSDDPIDFNPTDLSILQAHLTNTCLQTNNEAKQLSVMEFDKLKDIPDDEKLNIKKQIYEIAHDLFLAAKTVNPLNFQSLPNALETFGVDFLVDDNYKVKILEVNAYPDFKQTGDDLKNLIDELFLNVVQYGIKPLLNSTVNQVDGKTTSTPDYASKHTSSFKKVLTYTSNEW